MYSNFKILYIFLDYLELVAQLQILVILFPL